MKAFRKQSGVWSLSIGWIAVLAGCSQQRGPVSPAPAAEAEVLPAVLAEVARECNLSIELLAAPLPWYAAIFQPYRTDPATPGQARAYTLFLASELRRYPPAFFQRIRLERILLCGRIRDGTFNIGGYADAGKNAIYLSMTGDHSEDYHRESVHHEVFHVLDERNGDAWDAEWRSLNPKGFRYGGSKRKLWQTCERGGESFLIADGKRNIGEDHAHYFAYMMTYYAAIRDLGRRDPLVRAKADLMEKLLADFCPAMDVAFWAEAQCRSESDRDRYAASLRHDWMRVEPGVDPLNPDRPTGEPFAMVRPTRFPDCQELAFSKGRTTKLCVPLNELALLFYNVSPARCVLPEELKTGRFDLVVSLPDVKEDFDPRVREAARTAFEAEFGLTVRKETREVDVYLLKLGPTGTELLERASQHSRQMPSAVDAARHPGRPRSRATSEAGTETDGDRMLFYVKNWPLAVGLDLLEHCGLDRPLIDETGFTKPISVATPYTPNALSTLKALAEALGLQVVPGRQFVEMTVLEASSDFSK